FLLALIGNVGVGAEPPGDLAVFSVQRLGARKIPAITPVAPAQPEQVLPAFAFCDGPAERRNDAIRLLWVEHTVLQVFGNVAFAKAGVGVETLVVPHDAAGRIRNPDELRDRFGERAKPFLALADAALAFKKGPGIAGDLAGA